MLVHARFTDLGLFTIVLAALFFLFLIFFFFLARQRHCIQHVGRSFDQYLVYSLNVEMGIYE